MDASQLVMTVDLTINPPTGIPPLTEPSLPPPPPPPPPPVIGRRKRQAMPVPIRQCIDLSLISDSIVEDDEIFTVSLGSNDNGVIVDPTPLTVTILDNDSEHMHLVFIINI